MSDGETAIDVILRQSVEIAKLRGKIFALEKAGDAMDLLLTGSMKPSKGVRDAWESTKKLDA